MFFGGIRYTLLLNHEEPVNEWTRLIYADEYEIYQSISFNW